MLVGEGGSQTGSFTTTGSIDTTCRLARNSKRQFVCSPGDRVAGFSAADNVTIFVDRPISSGLLIATAIILVPMILPSFSAVREEAFHE